MMPDVSISFGLSNVLALPLAFGWSDPDVEDDLPPGAWEFTVHAGPFYLSIAWWRP